MRGLVFENGKPKLLTGLRVPRPSKGWSLVRVILAGICNTDLEIAKGYMDFTGIPGHEFVGEIIESGKKSLIGKRVVGEISAACGTCETCLAGHPRHCPTRKTLGISGLDGAFCDYLVLPDENLFPLPKNISDEAAVFTEPVAAACEILEQVPIDKITSVLVVGAGKMGLLIAQVIRTTGCNLTVLTRRKQPEAVLTRLGIPYARTKALAGRKFDVVVEASGAPEGLAIAQSLVRPRGTIVLKSTTHEPPSFWAAGLVIDEITLVGSRCGPFAPAIRLLKNGHVRTDLLIDSRFGFAKAKSAFRRAAANGAGKVLLQIND